MEVSIIIHKVTAQLQRSMLTCTCSTVALHTQAAMLKAQLAGFAPTVYLHLLPWLQLPRSLLLQNANVGGYTSRGFVEILAASQSPYSKKWFQGTADAVRQYLWLFENAMRDGVEDFLILSGETLPTSGYYRKPPCPE